MLKKLRNFLKTNNIDYLLVNTTDEFLVEYNELTNCARYYVTGFTGSTGDVLLSQDELWQFVDGRYHEQADAQVDHSVTTVVKLQLGQTFSDELVNRVEKNSTIAVVSQKISLNFYKSLKQKLGKKNVKIKALDFDPVENFAEFKTQKSDNKATPIDIKICGISADEKLKQLKHKLRLKNEKAYIDTNLENIAYLTNFRQYMTPFSSTFKAKLIVTNQGATVYTDEISKVSIGNYYHVEPLKNFDKDSKRIFKKYKKVIYNPSTINYRDYLLIKNKAEESPYDFIKEMKSIKNNFEIKHFKENFKRTDNVVNKTFELVSKSSRLTEKSVSDFVEKEFLAQGANQLSFKTILAAGENSSIIHYSNPSESIKIKNGDFVLLDCGGHFEGGYSTDITRTFVKGTPSDTQKTVYTTVLRMFLNAYNYKVTNKTSGFTLDKIARKIHKQSGLKDFNFNHGLGHGVGINVHENPPTISCAKSCKRPLKPNMVFTIEPGLYKQGFGGVRLENTVYLKKSGKKLKIQSLSHVPFQENIIDYSLLTKQEKNWLKNWQSECQESAKCKK